MTTKKPLRFIAEISKTFTFDAAHFLPTVPEDHKCRRMHGHTYRVELVLRDEVAPNGFVGGVDYEHIAKVWSELVHDVIDHRVLNDIPELEIPSTEHLGWWIFRQLNSALPGLVRLRVHESSTTWCEVTKLELECAGLLKQKPYISRRPHKEPTP